MELQCHWRFDSQWVVTGWLREKLQLPYIFGGLMAEASCVIGIACTVCRGPHMATKCLLSVFCILMFLMTKPCSGHCPTLIWGRKLAPPSSLGASWSVGFLFSSHGSSSTVLASDPPDLSLLFFPLSLLTTGEPGSYWELLSQKNHTLFQAGSRASCPLLCSFGFQNYSHLLMPHLLLQIPLSQRLGSEF